MFCTNCGKQLDDSLRFCIYCGHEIKRPAGDVGLELAGDSEQAEEIEASKSEQVEVVEASAPEQSEEGEASNPEQESKPETKGTEAVEREAPEGELEILEAEPQDPEETDEPLLESVAETSATQAMPPSAQAPHPVETERPREKEVIDLPPMAAIVMACLAVVALLAALFLPHMLGRPSSGVTQSAEGESGKTTWISPSRGQGEDDAAGEDEGTPADDAVEGPIVRAQLSSYSWDELAQIAAEISNQASRSDALDVAIQYKLVNADGTMSSNTKDIALKDGTRIAVRIIDVYHDDRADGASKAGLTFMATSSVGNRKYHGSHKVAGGWEASDMRAYLNGSFLNLLPNDLWMAIVPVRKLSNNVGVTTSTSSVTATNDEVWLPSVVEVCGPLTWDYTSNPRNKNAYNAIFSAEGSQYAYFSQFGVTDEDGPQGATAMGGTWWMRSVAPSTSRGRWVDERGNPACFGDADDSRGVMIAFCL